MPSLSLIDFLLAFLSLQMIIFCVFSLFILVSIYVKQIVSFMTMIIYDY